jgi:hypothetical protein
MYPTSSESIQFLESPQISIEAIEQPLGSAQRTERLDTTCIMQPHAGLCFVLNGSLLAGLDQEQVSPPILAAILKIWHTLHK